MIKRCREIQPRNSTLPNNMCLSKQLSFIKIATTFNLYLCILSRCSKWRTEHVKYVHCCRSKECDVVRGECTQTYVPYLFLVIPLGPVTLTGQDYVLVESGCVCKPKYAPNTPVASAVPPVPNVWMCKEPVWSPQCLMSECSRSRCDPPSDSFEQPLCRSLLSCQN